MGSERVQRKLLHTDIKQRRCNPHGSGYRIRDRHGRAVAQTVQAGATSVPTAVIQVVIPSLPTAPATPNGSATPSTVAEVLHDTSTELALNKDGSLRVTRNFVVNVATK